LTQAIRQFAQQLDEWLTESLSHLPEPLQNKKLAGKRDYDIYQISKAFYDYLK